MHRKTYAEINLQNLYLNYINTQEKTNGTIVIPVVKANAYGHGVIEVVDYLVNKGITYFAVSLVEEAIEIREKFADIDILIMGVTHKEDYEICSKFNLTITISNMDQIDSLMEIRSLLKVHIKIDSGMNRLGFKENQEIKDSVIFMENHHNIDLIGIYTHFATADGDFNYYSKQRTRFEEVLEFLDYNFKMVHCSNSSSLIKYEKDINYTTHSRLGISLYGLTLDKDTSFLLNTYRLCTHIAEINHLKKGDKLGYGITYEAQENEVIGILPIGYADGFIRKNQGGDVEINGKRYKIVGRICMDQMFIRINDSISKNDQVVLFGGEVSIDEVANRLQTINYEIICQITYRVPKIYIGKDWLDES